MKLKILVTLFFLCLGTCLLASNQYGVSDTRQVTFYEQVKVGDTVLPAGEYKVVHTMQGESHIMLFRRIDGGNGALATVKCTLKPLSEPAKKTELRYSMAGGVKILTQMQFKGDTAVHTF